jgi:DNA-binding transcriptional MerR regulator/effector-binding domain-containing protein
VPLAVVVVPDTLALVLEALLLRLAGAPLPAGVARVPFARRLEGVPAAILPLGWTGLIAFAKTRDVPAALLPIGSFARRCRLSVKALRHYDDLGLLRPARVDVATGYRYYDRRQAPAAIAIALLRSLDVALPAIRELLARDDPDALARVLDHERARRAREIVQAESALRSIERLMRAGTVFPYDIAEREESAQTLLVVEGRTAADLHVPFGMALVTELLARLARLELDQTGPIVCLLSRVDDDTLFLQMGTPLVGPRPPGERIVELPAGRTAVTRHVGPYEEAGLADLALHAWAEERGLEASGPLREIYRNDPAEVPPDALETDVVLPVSRP